MTPQQPDPRIPDIILDSIADGVFTVDADRNITSFNRAAEDITGISRDKAIGQKCFDVFRANICQNRCALQATMDGGQHVVDQRVDILNCHGETVPISISTAVLQDAEGNAIGGVETFRDLSTIEELRRQIDDRHTFQDIISKNHQIRRILEILPDVAISDSTVLIEGPTGSGKELFAKAIHNLSRRRRRKYVAVNCGALPDTLLESELFGYRKGAFTDARKDKPGRFTLAEKGTLFLDEISDISTALQVKLLRVLQEKEYEPLGATRTVQADVRVIAATNKPLVDQVAGGTFREDLYYRLNVVRIQLPALCQRQEDIPLLAHHFLRHFNAEQGKRIQGFTDDALAALLRYPFPGNVRELRNVVERAVVLCRRHEIDASCLSPDIQQARSHWDAASNGTASPLINAEAQAILHSLQQNQGHRGKTAAALGIDTSTLWRKMKRHQIAYP